MKIAFSENLEYSILFILLLIIKIYTDIILFIRAAKKNKVFKYPKIYKFINNILISNLGLLICFVLNLFTPINKNEINKVLCKIQSIGLKIFVPSSDLNLLIYVLLIYHEVFYSFDSDLINYHFYISLPYVVFILLQIPEFFFKNFDNKFNGIYCFENKFRLFHSKISSTIFFIYFVKIICFIIIIIMIINIAININAKKQTDIYEFNIYLTYFKNKLSFILTYIITSLLIFIFKINVINKKKDYYYWMIIVSYEVCGIIYSFLFAWNSNLLSCRIKVTKIKSHSSSISSNITEISSELSYVI